MKIKMIVAYDEDRSIGKNNHLLVRYSEDLDRFREMTTNGIVIMGRKTHESIGYKLRNRVNVVLTRNKEYKAKDGIRVYNTLKDALNHYKNKDEVYIIGGGQIYKEGLDYADVIEATELKGTFNGDTYFPELNEDWIETKREEKELFNFVRYEKVK